LLPGVSHGGNALPGVGASLVLAHHASTPCAVGGHQGRPSALIAWWHCCQAYRMVALRCQA
jgi:hypothetical protein